MKLKKLAMAVAVAATLAGCASNPETDSRLAQLDQRFDRLMNYQQASTNAPVATEKALNALNSTREAYDSDLSDEVIDHRLYLAERRLDILERAISNSVAEATVENAELSRKEIVLKAKTIESERAKRDARVMEAHAVVATEQAIDANAQAAAMHAHAQRETARAQQLQKKIDSLESKVDNLTMQNTERGVVLTLGDILFEVDSDQLKADTDVTLDEVAAFLKSYPEREIRVEGFTDDTGSASYNERLSLKRAASVKEALTERGLEDSRISVHGYGEERPIVRNDSAAHREKNRRVEIILEPAKVAAVTQ